MRRLEPDGVAGPFATDAHGVVVESPARLLFGAGQVGVDEDGRIGEGVEEQSRLCWENIRRVLAADGMTISDIVQLNMLLVAREDREAAMAVRDRELGDHRPASTLMFISGLARPEYLIEIDFVAAREG
jgi:2-iminobutanoate/2-iminopropanoate deaminase